MLRQAEKKILRFIKSSYRGFFVDIGNTGEKMNFINGLG
jgi:hypothetical protein